MSQDLLAIVRRSLGDELVPEVAKRVRESEDKVRATFDCLLPVIVGMLVDRGATVEGARVLMRTMANVPLDALVLANPAKLLKEDAGILERVTTMGPGMLGQLLGNKAGQLPRAVGSATGVRAASASWMAAFLAPLVLAYVNREVQVGKLDEASVHRLLAAQQESLVGHVDERIVGALNMPALNIYMDEPQRTGRGAGAQAAIAAEPAAAPRPKRGVKPYLPWVVLVAIVVVWLVLRP